MNKVSRTTLNILPLIDLTLVLVLFLLYAVKSMSFNENISFNLPSLTNLNGLKMSGNDQTQSIFVKSDTEICLDDFCVKDPSLLSSKINKLKLLKVYANKEANFETSLKLLRAFQEAGIEKVDYVIRP